MKRSFEHLTEYRQVFFFPLTSLIYYDIGHHLSKTYFYSCPSGVGKSLYQERRQ